MIRMLPALCVLACLATVSAQGKPDFSGTWTATEGQTLAPDRPVKLSVRRSDDGPSGRLFVERESASGNTSDAYTIGVLGGVVSGSPGGTRHVTRSDVVWRGETLVIFAGEYSGPDRGAGPYTEVAEEWRLDARGQLVITTTRRRSDAEPVVTTVAYGRQ